MYETFTNEVKTVKPQGQRNFRYCTDLSTRNTSGLEGVPGMGLRTWTPTDENDEEKSPGNETRERGMGRLT